MGFDLSQVLSEPSHYTPFVCTVCQNLVEHKAVVTSPCSHPFCQDCLQSWAQECADKNTACCCPSCQTDLSGRPSRPTTAANGDSSVSAEASSSMMLGDSGLCLAVRPLEQAQPLAHQVLMQVQVACIDFSAPDGAKNSRQCCCKWTGDYSQFLDHAHSQHGQAATTKAFSPRGFRGLSPKTSARPSIDGLRSISLPSIMVSPRPARLKTIAEDFSDKKPTKVPDQNSEVSSGRRASLQKSSSLGMLQSSEQAEPLELSPGQMPGSGAEEKGSIGINNNNNNSDAQVSLSPRWKTNESISSTPESEKPSPGRRGDAPPNLVTRQPSDDESAKSGNKNFKSRALKRKPFMPDDNPQQRPENTDLEVSYSHALDWNNSISSAGGWNNSFSEGANPVMETVEEDDEDEKEFELEFEPDEEAKQQEQNAVEKIKQILEKAEKLKKQANAKFNKGDFTGSRVLYTEGINAMRDITPDSPEERDLVSNLHSNRAVTFFREKKFESCIDDCEKALECDPTYEKSWIRKWRALMALGDFDSAFACLQKASEMVPGSKRIQVELEKAESEMELITTAREHIKENKFTEAKEVLRPHARSSDNIGLLFVAAKADAGLGQTESALEKVNKALRFNPTHREGLELRGYALFLSGDTEKGAHLLQEAYTRDKENKETKAKLISCQNTHSGFAKGRSCVKRGRYKDAVEHFTTAIKESGSVPSRAPLFISLRTERAEALLLSRKYKEALNDCQDVIDADNENATAWTLRAEVLIALDKTEEAFKELVEIRRTWGWDNPTINEGYRRVDFELRVLKADSELTQFVSDLESGKIEGLTGSAEKNAKRDKDKKGERRTNRGGRNLNRSKSRSRSRSRRRRSSKEGESGDGDKHVGSERRRSGEEKESTGRKATSSTFVPPPSIADMTRGKNDGGERRKKR